MSEIEDLVSRLRSLTGYIGATSLATPSTGTGKTLAPPTPAEKRTSAASLLLLQQSLRRHPCFAIFGASTAETHCRLLQELDDAVASAPAETVTSDVATEHTTWRLFINDVAEVLALERISGVFADPAARLARAKEDLFRRIGAEDFPQLNQVGEGYPCPWNVLVTLEDRLHFSQDDFREFAKATLTVPNATSGILNQLRKVHEDTYQTMAWLQLLHQLTRFPISSVRAVWQAALYHFPTTAPLVCMYVRFELAALAKRPRLDSCSAETDAKDVYKDTLRLLHVFYRHLPLTFSCELYSLFFSFVADYIQPDNTSLDLLYRTCLRRDVGMLPQSTPLWMRYLTWSSTTIRDHNRRREWRKRLFRRLLSTPLLGLDKVKEEYDRFLETEYRGRVMPDEKFEVEKRLARVRAEADDLSRLMFFFYPSEWEPASTTVTFPHTLYLPRPLVVDGPEDPNSMKDSVLSRIEMDLWASWYALLQRTRRPLLPESADTDQHYGRCRGFMTMMAAYFPHQPTLWMELIGFCVHEQPKLSEQTRFNTVAAAMELATTFHRCDVCVRLFITHTYVTDFAATELAYAEMKECLLHLRSWLLHYARSDAPVVVSKSASGARGSGSSSGSTVAEVLEKLQHITVLAINFMRMGSTQGEDQHLHLVARFVMHQIDFLSITMAVLRKLLKANAIPSPAPFLRPFNLFCAQWITLELIRSRAAKSALLVLQQWCEHLQMMLRSGRNKPLACEDWGVDELLLDTCASLLTADPSTSLAVAAALAQLEALVGNGANANTLQPGNFLYLARQLRHRFFLPFSSPSPDDGSDVLLQTKLLQPHAAPHRYDTKLFTSPPPRLSFQDELDVEGTTPVAVMAKASLAPTDEEEEGEKTETARPTTQPEESLWSAAAAFRNSSVAVRPSFDRPRRGPPFASGGNGAGGTAELPRAPTTAPPSLAVVSESTRLPTLLDCLAARRGSSATELTKLPPLEKLERLLVELPSLYEYDPLTEEADGGREVLTEAVLNMLVSSEALS